jgi:drug/metabolite transporter (DMT)-like permease
VAVTRRGWVLFAVMCVVWGIPYLLIKVAVGGVSVPVVVFSRTALGAVILLPAVLRSGQLAALRAHWRPLLAFAVLEMVAPWGLLSNAEEHLPSSLAGLLIAAVPIIGVVLARLTGGTERLSVRRWAGLILGLAGVGVLAGPHLSGGSAWPVTEVLLVALGYAAAPLIASRRLADVPSLPMTAACLSLAAVVYAPAAIATWPTRLPSGRVLASIAALGVVCTACALVVFLALIREVGTSRAMTFTYVNPAVAVAAGVALLGEPFTGLIAASFVLILGGCVLATGSRRDQPVPAAPAVPAGPTAATAPTAPDNAAAPPAPDNAAAPPAPDNAATSPAPGSLAVPAASPALDGLAVPAGTDSLADVTDLGSAAANADAAVQVPGVVQGACVAQEIRVTREFETRPGDRS